MHGSMASLNAWDNYYVIVGAAAATLTGLMFVVMTLTASLRQGGAPVAPGASGAFGGPNVVHFCVALFVSAALTAPWPALWNLSVVFGLCGVCGVGYVAIIFRRIRQQQDYDPVTEDWLFHVILPLVAYVALALGAFLLNSSESLALFLIAAAPLLLLFIGIHNAWDTVTYVTYTYGAQATSKDSPHDE